MRRGIGLVGALVTLIVLVVVGAIAYNIGWSDGVNTHLPAGTQGAVAPGPYYGGFGFHPFFAFFGIFWFLLILFGIFWLFRLAFWGFAGRRMVGGGGWGYGKGMGYGHGSFEDRAQEWHRRQHGEQPPTTGSGTTPPPPPPDTRNV